MEKRPLTKRENARLEAMNKQLWPAKLRYIDPGSFQFDYRRDGKVKRKVISHNMEEAYERALVMRKELDDLPVITMRRMTLEQWYDDWAEKRFPKMSPTTAENYRQYWKRMPDTLKVFIMDKLSAERISNELESIDKPSMKEHVAVFLSTLLNQAEKAGHLMKSPWKASHTIRPKPNPIVPIKSVMEVIKLATPFSQPGLALAAFCGLRRGEIMALNIGDIDLARRQVYVTKGRVRVYGKENSCDAGKSTKTDRSRFIPLPSIAIPFIEPALEGKELHEKLYPIFQNNLHRTLATACKRAGVQRMTLHGLRHNCISHLVMKKNLKLAQQIAGHTRIQTTADRYTHLLPEYVQQEVEAVFTVEEKQSDDDATDTESSD